MKKLWSLCLVILAILGQAQNKEERINRDIEVAENVLSTIIKQQLDRRSSFWPMDVKGSYTPGYGVTLRVPINNFPFIFVFPPDVPDMSWPSGNRHRDLGDRRVIVAPGSFQLDVEKEIQESLEETDNKLKETDEKLKQMDEKLKLLEEKNNEERDSVRNAFDDKLLTAAKIFLTDYGDLISIEPNEKIIITTKSDRGRNYVVSFSGDYRRPQQKLISVEATKSDLIQYRQGKLTRDQLLSKFKVVNSVINEERYPDLELLSTIFKRLYSSDLSKTYFMSSTPYYERMNDFGATFFMQFYSSNGSGSERWDMPTVGMEDLSQAERDKKVTELYPVFEKDLKENFIEYGRTLNSLKDEEILIFDVTLTKCKGCDIPSTVELSVMAGVLKDYSSGKVTKENALAKVNLKKGPGQ